MKQFYLQLIVSLRKRLFFKKKPKKEEKKLFFRRNIEQKQQLIKESEPGADNFYPAY